VGEGRGAYSKRAVSFQPSAISGLLVLKAEGRFLSMERQSTLGPHDNPWEILGVASNATNEEIRASYLKKVKEHPPERSPEAFERIRDAYELLRDPRRRALRMLLAADPWAPLVSLLADKAPERRFVGPGPWLAVLKEK